jgi:hypothetical protein
VPLLSHLRQRPPTLSRVSTSIPQQLVAGSSHCSQNQTTYLRDHRTYSTYPAHSAIHHRMEKQDQPTNTQLSISTIRPSLSKSISNRVAAHSPWTLLKDVVITSTRRHHQKYTMNHVRNQSNLEQRLQHMEA